MAWNYDDFERFLHRVATSANIDIDHLHRDDRSDKISSDQPDDIVILLEYHDHGREYTKAEECAKIIPRLQNIISQWDVSANNDKSIGIDLISGMRHAVELNTAILIHG